MATKLQELLEELKGLKRYYIEVDSDCDFELVEQGRQDLIKTPELLIKDFELDTLITKYTETTHTYKPGDNVRVIGNMFGHPFTLGEPIILTMTIDDPIEGIWSAIQEVGSLRGNITEAEFEPIN